MAATLSDYILDNGLNALQTANTIHVTNAEQTTYASATSVANSLASNPSPRPIITPPTPRSSNGSKVANLSTTIAADLTGEAHFWYFVDEVNSRLLARGAIAGSVLYTFFVFDGGAIHYPAFIPPGDSVQIPSIGSNCVVDPWVLNNGLEGLKATANKIYICSATPTTFIEATSGFALGNKDLGVGGVYTAAIAAGTAPVGRQLSSVAIPSGASGGNVTSNGTATRFAVVDSVNSRLLLNGVFGTGSLTVTSGQHFALGTHTIKLVSN